MRTAPAQARPIVLVLSDHADRTADLVTEAVRARGRRVLRCDTADFPQRLTLSARIGGGGWFGQLNLGEQRIDLRSIATGYVRRPSPFQLPPQLTALEQRHAGLEARYGLGGVLRGLGISWCNDMSASADAAYKPAQLALFEQCGLRVPRTLVTNEAAAVRTFAAESHRIVVKPLLANIVRTPGRGQVVYTHLLRAAELEDLSGVEHTAHLFQEYVDKEFEVRVTVVGRRVFAVRIDAGSERATVDWRTDYPALRYSVLEPPANVHDAMLRYLDQARLTFGAFDFAVSRDGHWYALECNPEGQWEWLAEECALPIADALADVLTADTQAAVA